MARFQRALETGVFGIMRNSNVTSILRYGLVVIGSGLQPDAMDKMETQITNKEARMTGGPDRFSRLEALHFVAPTHCYRNKHILHCAELIGAAIRAHNSSISTRIRAEIGAIIGHAQMTVVSAGWLEKKPEISPFLVFFSRQAFWGTLRKFGG